MKRIKLSLLSLTSLAVPAALVVSCGSGGTKTPAPATTGTEQPTTNPTTNPLPVVTPETTIITDTSPLNDHVFDHALRIRNIKDQGINWSLIASESNATYSANDYEDLITKSSVRTTWLNKFKASFNTFAADVYDTSSQTDFVYSQHYIDVLASGGAKTNPLTQYISSGMTASTITNIAVIENSNTGTTLKQRILVRFFNLIAGYVEFEVQGTLANPTFRLTGPAGTVEYTPSSDIRFVPRNSKSMLMNLPDDAFVVTHGFLSRVNEPMWEHGKIMNYINNI